MNTGVEAGETAVKLARKWAYMKKGVPENQGFFVSFFIFYFIFILFLFFIFVFIFVFILFY